MDNDAVADQRANDCRAGADGAVATDADIIADDGIGANDGARTDLRALPDNRAGIYDDAGLQPGVRMHGASPGEAMRGIDGLGPNCLWIKPGGDSRKGAVWVQRHQRDCACRRFAGVARGDEAGGSAGFGEVRRVARIIEKDEIARPGAVERGDAFNAAGAGEGGGVSLKRQFRASPGADVGKSWRDGPREENRIAHTQVRCQT